MKNRTGKTLIITAISIMTALCGAKIHAEILSDAENALAEELISGERVEKELPYEALLELPANTGELSMAGAGSSEDSSLPSDSAGTDRVSSEEDTVMPEISMEPTDNPVRTVIYRLRDLGAGNLKIYWRVKHEADGYQIRYSTDKAFKTGVRTASFTDRNNNTRHGLNVGTTYYVGVRTFIYSNGKRLYSPWSGTKSLTLERTLPGTAFTKVTRNTDGSISARWTKNAEVDGYQLSYSDDSLFRNEITASVKKRSKTSYTRKGLAPDKDCYVRIRTYKYAENGEKYYSEWSKVFTV